MSSDVSDYIRLITSWHSTRPKFVATVGATVQPLADVQGVLAGLPADFDLDEAVGAQLDVVGEWIGRSRQIPFPVGGLFFSWGTDGLGWGQGRWKGPFDPTEGLISLDDDTYRALLRATVLSNTWDGTVPGVQAILDEIYTDPDTHVFVQDVSVATLDTFVPFCWGVPGRGWGQGSWQELHFSWGEDGRGWGQGRWFTSKKPPADMQFIIGVSGKLPTALTRAFLRDDLVPLRSAGVDQKTLVTTVDGSPLFGWGLSNEYVGGWGQGSWGAAP